MAGIDVMGAVEECVAAAVADAYARNEIYAFVEVVPTDLAGRKVATRGLLIETADTDVTVAFTESAGAARSLERRIERQQQAELERQGITGGTDLAESVRSRGSAVYWGWVRSGDPLWRCFR